MSIPSNSLDSMENLSIDSPIDVPNSQSIISSLFDDSSISPIEEESDSDKKVEAKKEEPKKEEPKKEEAVKPSIDHQKIIDSLFSDEEIKDEGNELKGKTGSKPEEGKKQEADNQEVKSDDQEVKSDNLFQALAKDLESLGIFRKDEDEEEIEIKSPEDFLERFKYEAQRAANETISNFLGRFGEDYVKAFEAIFVNGVNPRDYIAGMVQVKDISNIDLSVEENQEYVVRQALTEQGFDREDIDKEVERLKNYGDLEDVSKRYHKALVKKYENHLKELEIQQKERQRQIEEYKDNYRKSVKKILDERVKQREFDGIPINTKLAQEVYDFVVTEKYKTSSGDVLTEFDKKFLDLKRPENFEMMVKVATIMKILEKDPTLSLIQSTQKSKKNNSLFSELTKKADSSSKTSGSGINLTSWF